MLCLAQCMLLSLCALAEEATIISFDPPGSRQTIPLSINAGGSVTGYYYEEAPFTAFSYTRWQLYCCYRRGGRNCHLCLEHRLCWMDCGILFCEQHVSRLLAWSGRVVHHLRPARVDWDHHPKHRLSWHDYRLCTAMRAAVSGFLRDPVLNKIRKENNLPPVSVSATTIGRLRMSAACVSVRWPLK